MDRSLNQLRETLSLYLMNTRPEDKKSLKLNLDYKTSEELLNYLSGIQLLRCKQIVPRDKYIGVSEEDLNRYIRSEIARHFAQKLEEDGYITYFITKYPEEDILYDCKSVEGSVFVLKPIKEGDE